MAELPLWARLWERLQALPQPILLIGGGALGLGLLVLLVWSWRRLGARGRSRVLLGLFGLTAVGTAVLGTWSFRLPPPRGSLFVLWHQFIRVGAALSATLFTLGLLFFAVPRFLSLFQRGSFVFFVAARHVSSKKSGFLTIISLLSISGVAISSFALCAVISIMGGFGADLKSKILNNNAQIRIETSATAGFEYWREALDRVRLVPGVTAATPVAGGEVMASSSTNTAGVILRGVDTDSIGSVVDIPAHVEVGSFKYLSDPEAINRLPEDTPIGIGSSGEVYLKGPRLPIGDHDPGDEEAGHPGIVLGSELAKSLHVYVGDILTLVSPMGELGPTGMLPRTRKYRVAGVFYSGMYEYDAAHAYVTLEEAQSLLDLGHFVTAIDVRVKQVEAVETVTPLVRDALERKDLEVRDWKEMNRNLFSALQLEKIATFLILSIAIAVASFCIICTLLLMVTEKSKEIAILKAMGASDRSVLSLFLTEGMFIGGVGTLFGVTTGFIAMKSLETFGVRLDPEVYYVDQLPVHVDGADYLLIALCAFVITTLATLYPARAASRLRPVDGIRYE